jgi:hypothetical protein
MFPILIFEAHDRDDFCELLIFCRNTSDNEKRYATICYDETQKNSGPLFVKYCFLVNNFFTIRLYCRPSLVVDFRFCETVCVCNFARISAIVSRLQENSKDVEEAVP